MSANIVTRKNTIVEDPPIARFLFSDTRMAIVWLVIRVWVGWQWIQASLHKISDPGWVGDGSALKGFWLGALAAPNGKPVISFDWYRSFIQFLVDTQSYVWFGKLIAYGEFLVGLGLIVGAFVGIAAFSGALMNWNFIMAGSASTNGFLLLLAILLVLAWKVAGYYGADYFLLRWLGVPWKTTIVEQKSGGAQAAAPAK